MVNARLSARSARGYSRIGGLAREAFATSRRSARQTEADGQRMTDLGARYVMITGNIKFDIAPPPAMQALAADFRNRFGPQREILLAASTREGEEARSLEAFARMCPPEVLLVLVPRHPDRFDEVAKLAKRAGLKLQKRSKGVPVMADTRVWLGDSMGEMYAYYGAADVAIIGGSGHDWAARTRSRPARWVARSSSAHTPSTSKRSASRPSRWARRCAPTTSRMACGWPSKSSPTRSAARP